jgi:BASS family bile acid:Na+ symporter
MLGMAFVSQLPVYSSLSFKTGSLLFSEPNRLEEVHMREALPQILGILALIAVPLTGLCLGIETGRAYVSQLLRMPGVLIRFFLATFVIMPALAVVIRLSENLSPAVWVGLLLISMTPPSPGFHSKVRKLSVGAEMSLAWQLTSVLLSIVTIPLTLLILENALGLQLNWGIGAVTRKILLVYLAPVMAGMLWRRLSLPIATSVARIAIPISKVTLLLLVLLIVLIGAKPLISLGARSLLIVLLFVAVAILVGHLLGTPPPNLRPTLAGALAMRFPAPAFVLAKLNGILGPITPVILAYLIFGGVLLGLYSKLVRKHVVAFQHSEVTSS